MTAPPPGLQIRRSTRARRARLTLTDEGQPLVVLPVGADEQIAAQLVARHGRWLARHQARIRDRRAALAARPQIGHGRTILLRGHETPIVLAAPAAVGGRGYVRQESGRLVVSSPAGVAPQVLLERRLRAEARRDLDAAVSRRSAEMGLRAARVSVRDQRTRWGSASRRGTLSFSWRLVMCPPDVLDYVVVHELAHLRWAGHGARFWSLVRRYCPRADEHRRWLREHHALLRAALD
jgi:predicted metal-dependent hydrolase